MSKTPQGSNDNGDDDGGNSALLAERIRTACIDEALHAYQQAAISGLCHEGRFEAAISALRMLDLDKLVQRAA